MAKPLRTDEKPLSQTLGRFTFEHDSNDEIRKLREEIQELKSRIAILEQQQSRASWWKRF